MGGKKTNKRNKYNKQVSYKEEKNQDQKLMALQSPIQGED